MIVLCEAFVLAASLVAAIFAGADASAQTAVVDRSLTIVIRPAVNLAVKEANDSSRETSELTLADIVDVATIPLEDRVLVMRHLRAVGLTDRPNIGEERTFTEEGLEAIVGEASRRLEAAGYTIEWKIPRRSQVLRKNAFNRETILRMLGDEFRDRCSGCEVSITRLDLPQTMGLGPSWRMNVRSEKPRGSFAVPVEFDLAAKSGNLVKKTMMITGQVELFALIPVATRAIQGGEKISTGDFKLERRDITYALDAAAGVKDFGASVAARGLAVGEPIWKGSIRREQVVRFGDPVRVLVGGETWSVTSDGIAQGPASIGDAVRVKVGKSQKLVSGILKEKGLVEIQ
jgi:flagella basal body P-ring formation protein FlgA